MKAERCTDVMFKLGLYCLSAYLLLLKDLQKKLQQILGICMSFCCPWFYFRCMVGARFCLPCIIYFYILLFILTAFFIGWELFSFLVNISIFWLDCLDKVLSFYYCLDNIDQIYLINMFCAFILDNTFSFFEYANELIHMQIHLISFIKFIMILNQT